MTVTAAEVKAAMIAANITRVEHHNCSLCGYPVAYIRDGDQLLFDPGCDCSYGGREARSWDDVADYINMQNPEWTAKLRVAFGIDRS